MAGRDGAEATEAARRSVHTAAVLLADRDCARADVVRALARAWDEIAGALGVEPGPALVDAPPKALSRLFERHGEALAREVPRLHAAAERLAAGDEPNELPSRRELRRCLRLTRRAWRAARRDRVPASKRMLRLAPAVAVVLGVAALLFTAGWVVAERGGHGWRGLYYPNRKLEGDPVVRSDPSINFRWFRDAPWLGGPQDNFSVQWDTCLELPEAQTVEVRLGSDDGSRMFVDGELRVDNWSNHRFQWRSRTLALDAGTHHLRVQYYEASGDASATVELRQPGLPPSDLPIQYYRMPSGAADDPSPCR